MVLYWFLHNTVLQHCYAIVKHLYFHGFAPFVFSHFSLIINEMLLPKYLISLTDSYSAISSGSESNSRIFRARISTASAMLNAISISGPVNTAP